MKIISNKKYGIICSIISDQAKEIKALQNEVNALRALTNTQELNFPNSKERGFEDPNKIFFM